MIVSCIQATDLSKHYGSIKAVNGIDLSVDTGQIFGFLGPNGAGKSTTIKLLTTLIQPTSGSLTILGKNAIQNPIEVRKKIGVVLQQPSYEPTLTVEKSLEKYGMMWDVPKNERKTRMESLIADFELEDIRKKKNEDLSIGQRRRVQVAREFMHDIELLFLDEPTVGLDPNARRKLLDYIKNKITTGLTIFYTTHVLTEAEYLCDQIAIIDHGSIITVDSPTGLKEKFGNEKTIRIHLKDYSDDLARTISGTPDCTVVPDEKTIIIHSLQSEFILMKILKSLNDLEIAIDDISIEQTNLEDIFLKMVKDNASNI